MKTLGFKGIIIIIILTISFIISVLFIAVKFTSCVDYEYIYYFNVDGEHGQIYAEVGSEKEDSSESPIILMGSKNGYYHRIKFSAVPDEGYKVRAWRLNGEVVDGNAGNEYTLPKIKYNKKALTITVEFEAI